MTISSDDVTGLILAGGRATRMGGCDKGLQCLNGEPMITHVLRRLRPQVDGVLINANRHLDVYGQFGVPVVADELAGFAGPLAGVEAGLRRCRTRYLATAPCDSPLLPSDLVARLRTAMEQAGSEVAVAVTRKSASGDTDLQRHPVFMLINVDCLPHLQAWLTNGGRKVDDWLRSLTCAEAVFTDDHAFDNINTQEQLNDIARRL